MLNRQTLLVVLISIISLSTWFVLLDKHYIQATQQCLYAQHEFAPQAGRKVVMKVKNILNRGLTIEKHLKQSQYKTRKKLRAAIRDAFEIDPHEWHQLMQYLERIKHRDTLLNPTSISMRNANPLKARVIRILKECGINPARVQLVLLHNPGTSPACALQKYDTRRKIILHRLELNSAELLNRPLHIQEGIIKHEAMHLRNYDSMEQGYIEGTLQRYGFQAEKYSQHPAMVQFNHYKELWADELAALTSMHTAHALRHDFTCLYHAQGDVHTHSHPINSLRMRRLERLISCLEIEQSLRPVTPAMA